MVFESKLPTEDGRYRWREGRGSRIHVVTLKTRRGVTSFNCSTMPVETLKSRGEWSPAEKAEAPAAEAI
jgi:hypothetical protein